MLEYTLKIYLYNIKLKYINIFFFIFEVLLKDIFMVLNDGILI